MTLAGTLAGSPAANAGLTAGDTITALGGQSVSSADDIQQTLVKYHPGNSSRSPGWTVRPVSDHDLTLASGPTA